MQPSILQLIVLGFLLLVFCIPSGLVGCAIGKAMEDSHRRTPYAQRGDDPPPPFAIGFVTGMLGVFPAVGFLWMLGWMLGILQ